MMKIRKPIELIILASTVFLASVTAHAASTTIILDIIVDGGAFDGDTGTGLLIWEGGDVSGVSTTLDVDAGPYVGPLLIDDYINGNYINGTGKFLVQLDIFGQTFTGADASSTSTLTFSDSTASQLDLTVDSGINQVGIDSFSFVSGLNFSGVGSIPGDGSGSKPLRMYVTTVNTSVVPLPASAWLFVSGLLGLVGMQRRKS